MIALWLALAWAHPLAPSVLRLAETADGVEVVWRTPVARPVGTRTAPVLPCPTGEPPTVDLLEDAVETRWLLPCRGLAGRTIGVDGLEPGRPGVIAQWTTAAGTGTALLDPRRDRLQIPSQTRAEATVTGTLRFGVAHLLTGWDHLLFVAGLFLAVPGRRLVGAVTAFTAGHALSLGLAGTGLLALPGGPVELAIALSLVWLAAELLDDGPPGGGVLARWPAAICLPFGLVHGLGFAGAWLESGLGARLPAIAGFNLGIELAQLAVLAALWGVVRALGSPSPRARRGLAWAGGALAAFWVWERGLALLV